MTSFIDDDDMPLAKRRKLLLQQRDTTLKKPPSPLYGHGEATEPSNIVVIMDNSSDSSGEFPAAAPAAGASRPAPLVVSKQEPDKDQEQEQEHEQHPASGSSKEETVVLSDNPADDDTAPLAGTYKATTAATATEAVAAAAPFSGDVIEEIDLANSSSDDEEQPTIPRTASAPAMTGMPQPNYNSGKPPLNPSSRRHDTITIDEPSNMNSADLDGAPPPQPPLADSRPPSYSEKYYSNYREKAKRPSPGLSRSAVEKHAKEIFEDLTQPVREALKKSQQAWNQAAMQWREKNKPSAEDLTRRKQEDKVRQTEAAKKRAQNTPAARAALHNDDAGYCSSGDGGSGRRRHGSHDANGTSRHAPHTNNGSTTVGHGVRPFRPAADAPEIERRMYYRNVAQQKIASCKSFVQVLRVFGIPCDDPSKVKDAYRLAVRMYHPDSNSRDKAWNTAEEKVQAEEVMKIINERKEKEL